MVELEINGQSLSVEEGTSVIDAAETIDIYIPRFCYHKKLSVVANCRMCLVEIENAHKPLPACATTVTPGMKVFTQSKKALDAQRAVMEFLLINHPLDCPICDQGGECELQDQSVGFGYANSAYHRAKRSIASQSIGPLVATEMTRCIQCTRCIRVSEEICGNREMGAMFRGSHMEVGTYVEKAINSELSGNMIDVCPVGALTSKPYSFQGRAWELQEHAMVAAHDCYGSNIFVHTRGLEYEPRREIMRVVPRENESINEVWLSDRDRFSYLGFDSEDRVTEPMIKKNGKWQAVGWERALAEVADRMKGLVEMQGADQLGALLSPNSTVEECYLLQRLMRGLGSTNVDHRLRQNDFSDDACIKTFAGFESTPEDIEQSDVILLVGSHLRSEVPLANYRVLKASQEGAAIMSVAACRHDFNYPLTHERVVHINEFVNHVAAVYLAALQLKGESCDDEWINALKPDETEQCIAKQLHDSENPCLILGAMCMQHPHASQLRQLSARLMKLVGGKFNMVTPGANFAGGWLAGSVPHGSGNEGLNAQTMFEGEGLRGYVLLNVEPENDCSHPAEALSQLDKAGLVVCLTPYMTDTMQQYADFILPIAPYVESDGTYVNAMGQWQTTHAITSAKGQAKPAWKVLRVLANMLGLQDFDYKSVHEIIDQLKNKHKLKSSYEVTGGIKAPVIQPNELCRYGVWPNTVVDNVVRRSQPLQDTMKQEQFDVLLNQATADAMGLDCGNSVIVKQGDQQLQMTLQINDRLPDDMVWMAMGIDETAGFGESMGQISITRGDKC
ncbi:MAG: NADH-quinone oxidoreductase subunit NuoG [Coxiellaceae bacterium]|nr:NADH-quinone oxidoreductase subunit NuoG [Coxiellaceae bacterium]